MATNVVLLCVLSSLCGFQHLVIYSAAFRSFYISYLLRQLPHSCSAHSWTAFQAWADFSTAFFSSPLSSFPLEFGHPVRIIPTFLGST